MVFAPCLCAVGLNANRRKYTQAATTLSVSSIRQQFSIKENIHLSMWSYQFLSSIGKHLRISDDDMPDVQLQNGAYLFLASETGDSVLCENVGLQRSVGAQVELLNPKELKTMFPWINPDGVYSASVGKANEGWFDPWSLLNSLRRKSIALGVKYINADAVNIAKGDDGMVAGAHLQDPSNPELKTYISCNKLVNAAGPWAGYLVQSIGIDLPVRPRKRHVFTFSCPKGPKDMVLAVDPSGCWFRKEGKGDLYLCGKAPDEDNDPDASDLTVDYDYFQEEIWPCLAERVPAFEELKLQHSWAGFYDYNTFDQNAIIGVHPDIHNLYFVNGFSGHGIQQSPAVGNAISELLIDGKYSTTDLTRFGFDRIRDCTPLREKNIV
ncbi:FAD-dependent oxidoreductase domain-containing protein 1-like isoform X2 [Rhopilema esculentum]|uniref:FAD-dependent oxidoreductase domain-containing protein 1-like isoform X2 n=1 Tax=Rhopilema esculentum TaxID=499914 RepID=UPI0031D82752